ncbi:MAG: IS4 family transposase [Saprospiraceae bacterium]
MDKYKRNKSDFTRNRVWDFSTCFFFISRFLNKRIQTEIDQYFSSNNSEFFRTATASSFTQARSKISYKAFEKVNQKLVNYFYTNSFNIKTFHGFRLVAIDGSVFTVHRNKETIKAFGDNVLSKGKTWVKAQISYATDVLNNICLDATINPYKTDERNLAKNHLKRLKGNDLFLFDRGYLSRELIEQLLITGKNFCMRLPKRSLKEINDFTESEHQDGLIEILINKKIYTLRITKISLKSGEIEYLATTLTNQNSIGKKQLKSLYSMRWGVEEQFKDFKHALAIENFTGKKVNSIKQEFFANIMGYNLAMMAFYNPISQKKIEKKYRYKPNKRACLAILKIKWKELFFSTKSIFNLVENIVEALLKEIIPIRDGRSHPRGDTQKIKKKHFSNYVSVV